MQMDKIKGKLEHGLMLCEAAKTTLVHISKEDAEKILNLLKDQAEIVHCRECKYYCQTGMHCKYDGLYNSNSRHKYGLLVYEDWYCADGKRKEGL